MESQGATVEMRGIPYFLVAFNSTLNMNAASLASVAVSQWAVRSTFDILCSIFDTLRQANGVTYLVLAFNFSNTVFFGSVDTLNEDRDQFMALRCYPGQTFWCAERLTLNDF